MAKESAIVEFQDTRSLYGVSEPLWVTFRYPTDYSASEEDRIGLYKIGESDVDNPLATVQVGNPQGHWPCDSGQWREGKVSLDVSGVTSTDQLQLWYIRGHKVVGKSEAFALSLDPRLPSPFHSVDSSNAFISSPCSSRQTSEQLSSVGSPPQLSSSFTLVTVGVSQPTQPIMQPESNFFDISGSSAQAGESFIDVGLPSRNSPPAVSFIDVGSPPQPGSSFVLVTEGKSYEQLSSEYEVVSSEVAPHKSADKVTVDQLLFGQLKSEEGNKTAEVESESKEWENRPVPAPRRANEEEQQPASDVYVSDQLINMQDVHVPESVSPATTPSVDPSPLMSPVSGSVVPSPGYEVDMSASAVFVDQFTSQKEARILKNYNKELRQKLKKLTKHMEDMQREIDDLRCKLAESDARSSIATELKFRLKEAEFSKEKMEEKYKLLAKESGYLKQKVSELQSDCKTQVERNAKLLSKLQESETTCTVYASENAVLQVQTHQLKEQVEKLKRREQRKRENERPTGKREHREHRGHQASKPTKKEHHPKLNGFESKPSEQKVYEVRSKPRVERQHPEVQIRSNEHERAPALHMKQQTNRPTELPLGTVQQPTPAPRHKKKEDASRDQHSKPSEPNAQEEQQQQTLLDPQAGSLSEERIQEIVSQLRGENLEEVGGSSPVVECPICQKQLFARENDYGVQLHVEHCLAQSQQ